VLAGLSSGGYDSFIFSSLCIAGVGACSKWYGEWGKDVRFRRFLNLEYKAKPEYDKCV